MTTQEHVSIARLLRPQGRKGEVLADLLTDRMDEFRAGRVFSIAASPTEARKQTTLEDYWLPLGKNAGRVVLKLSSANNISEAEMLAGFDLLIPLDELPELEDDTFYIRDLVGCTLLDGGTMIGEISDVQFATSSDGRVRLEDAAPLLVVQIGGRDEPELVPFVKAYLLRVDVAAKQVIMHLPEGLLDAEGDSST